MQEFATASTTTGSCILVISFNLPAHSLGARPLAARPLTAHWKGHRILTLGGGISRGSLHALASGPHGAHKFNIISQVANEAGKVACSVSCEMPCGMLCADGNRARTNGTCPPACSWNQLATHHVQQQGEIHALLSKLA